MLNKQSLGKRAYMSTATTPAKHMAFGTPMKRTFDQKQGKQTNSQDFEFDQRDSMVTQATNETRLKSLEHLTDGMTSEEIELRKIQMEKQQKEQLKKRNLKFFSKLQSKLQEKEVEHLEKKYQQAIEQTKAPLIQLGLVDRKCRGNKKTASKSVMKNKVIASNPYPSLLDRIKVQDNSKKEIQTSEQIELQLIKDHGSFKARSLNRKIFEQPIDRTDCYSTVSRFAQFKEFNLLTQNLHCTKHFQNNMSEIKRKEAEKFEYIPFKALKLNKKIYGDDIAQSCLFDSESQKARQSLMLPPDSKRLSTKPQAKKGRESLPLGFFESP